MAFNDNWKKQQKLEQIAKWPDEKINRTGQNRAQFTDRVLQIVGHVVFEDDPDYEASRVGRGRSSDEARPKLIVYCETYDDIRLCLRWSKEMKLDLVVRSGGHSTGNFSVNNGIVIDISKLSSVFINRKKMKARVEAGTQFDKFESYLDTHKLHVPTGLCPTVAVAGFTMGGGHGFTSRAYGMASDCVLSIKMMLGNGKIVVANKKKNPDLFWAVRGGTGGNFGVLLEITFKLFELPPLCGFVLQWPIDQAAEALANIQQKYMLSGDLSRLGYYLVLMHKGIKDNKPEPVLVMAGMYQGSPEKAEGVIEKFKEIGKPNLRVSEKGSYRHLNNTLFDFMPGIEPVSKPYLVFEEKDGGYISNLIDKDGWQKIVDVYKKTPDPYNIAYCEVYGGGINSFPAEKSAFIHRDNFTDLYIDSFWTQDPANPHKEKPAKEWLADFMSTLQPLLNGHRYQNYPKKHFTNYRFEYWGDAFNSLLFVKNKYDPYNIFNSPQGITPYLEGDNTITRSEAPSMFTDKEIIYESYSGEFDEAP